MVRWKTELYYWSCPTCDTSSRAVWSEKSDLSKGTASAREHAEKTGHAVDMMKLESFTVRSASAG